MKLSRQPPLGQLPQLLRTVPQGTRPFLPVVGFQNRKSLDRSVNDFELIGCNLSDLGLCVGRIAVMNNTLLPSYQHNNSLSISMVQVIVSRTVSLRRNRMNECLLRAGFHYDERYNAVLFDPERRIAIRLLERDPRTVLG